MSPADRTQAFAIALGAVESTLDWEELGGLYCHEGGEGFFRPDQREAIQDTGLRFAGDLGEHLDARGPGRSLYIGVGVAEIAPILFEAIVLGRKVQLFNLPGPEPTALDAAFEAAESACDHKLPRFTTKAFQRKHVEPIDHLWLVSVLTDPEAFPALHDQLYERQGTKQAVGGGRPKAERQRAYDLCRLACTGLKAPAFLTTSDEELPVLMEACTDLRLDLDVPTTARLSGIVGDAVRHCRVRRLK
jgi:hypothetical protein